MSRQVRAVRKFCKKKEGRSFEIGRDNKGLPFLDP